jgi:hypothetical protein
MSKSWLEQEDEDWPPPSPEAVARAAAAPEGRERMIVHALIALHFLLLVALPWAWLKTRPPLPVTEVRAVGYYLKFGTKLRSCGKYPCSRLHYYIGTSADGKCYAYQRYWEMGPCAERLRQVDTLDCGAAPEYNTAWL